MGESASSRQNVAIGVVGILCDDSAIGSYKSHYIALQVQNVVIRCTVENQGKRTTVFIVEEIQRIIAVEDVAIAIYVFLNGLAILPEVVVGHTVYSFGGSGTIQVIGVSRGGRAIACGGQASAVRPAQSPAGAVVVAGRVAGTIVGNGLSIVSSQQVPPISIAVGVGMTVGGEDIAYAVIGIVVSGASLNCLRQLTLGIDRTENYYKYMCLST